MKDKGNATWRGAPGTWAEIRPEIGHSIMSSRLLILQSKRLLMNSYQRRFDEGRRGSLERRIDELRYETESAQQMYRSAILAWGSPEHQDYWLIAYGRMIEKGNLIVTMMRTAATILPLSERYQVSADVEMLEDMVEGWTDSMRREMVGAAG